MIKEYVNFNVLLKNDFFKGYYVHGIPKLKKKKTDYRKVDRGKILSLTIVINSLISNPSTKFSTCFLTSNSFSTLQGFFLTVYSNNINLHCLPVPITEMDTYKIHVLLSSLKGISHSYLCLHKILLIGRMVGFIFYYIRNTVIIITTYIHYLHFLSVSVE